MIRIFVWNAWNGLIVFHFECAYIGSCVSCFLNLSNVYFEIICTFFNGKIKIKVVISNFRKDLNSSLAVFDYRFESKTKPFHSDSHPRNQVSSFKWFHPICILNFLTETSINLSSVVKNKCGTCIFNGHSNLGSNQWIWPNKIEFIRDTKKERANLNKFLYIYLFFSPVLLAFYLWELYFRFSSSFEICVFVVVVCIFMSFWVCVSGQQKCDFTNYELCDQWSWFCCRSNHSKMVL